MYKNEKCRSQSLTAVKESSIRNYLPYFIIGLIIILAFATMQTASASNIYVNSTGNDNTGNGSLNNPYKTINWGISKSNSGDTINIGTGTFNTYTDNNHKDYSITITKNLNIKGAGKDQTVINATGKGWVFTVNSGYTVTISDLSIVNGSATNSGGGISNSGTLTVNNCNIKSSTGNDGGAISNTGTLTINNCAFTSNTATGSGSNYGGAIYNTGTLTIADSTFTSNTVTSNSNYGGAIYNTGTMTITDCTFTGNSASNGGAIYNNNNGRISTITGNNFASNTATTNGGAIYNNAGTAEVHFNRIVGNTAPSGSNIYRNGGTVNAQNNWWGSNAGPSGISGTGTVTTGTWLILGISSSSNLIHIGGSSTITADMTHDNNGADTSSQGHIPDGIPINFVSTLGTINQGTTVNGRATVTFTAGPKPGTATVSATVDSQTMSTQITLGRDDVYISPSGNDASGDGSQSNPFKTIAAGVSGVYPGGTIHLANGIYQGTGNCNININKDITINGENRDLTIIDAQKSYKIFTIQSGNVIISNLILKNGIGINGGAIYNTGTLTITNCNLTGNFAVMGGAIYNTGTLTITSSNLANNSAITTGGTIYNTGTANIHFNRIIGTGNVIASPSGSVNAENNWWGSNANPSSKASGNVDVNPWLVLKVSSSPMSIPAKGTSTVTIDLTHNSNGDDTSSQGNLPDGILVNFINDILGTVNPISNTVSNSKASTTFTAGSKSGNSTISAKVDNQTVTVNVIIGSADLAIYKYLYGGKYTNQYHDAGLMFTISVNNKISSLNDATNVVVTNLIPKGYEFVSASPRMGTFNSTTMTWTIPFIARGGYAYLDIVLKVSGFGSLTNNATVSADQNDPYLWDNDAQNTSPYNVTATNVSDVQVTQTVSNNTPAHGQTIQITIKVKNNGPLTVPNVQIKDLLPTGLTYAGIYRIDQGSYNSGTGIWTIGSMNTGNELILILNATVNAQTGTLIYNDARRTDTSLPDYNTANNAQTIEFKVDGSSIDTGSADLAIYKYLYGGKYTNQYHDAGLMFTISVNNKISSLNDATNVVVTNLIPKGYEFVSASPRMGTFNSTTMTWTIPFIARGGYAYLDIVLKVSGFGSLTNNATVSADQNDPYLWDNDAQNTSPYNVTATNVSDVQVTQTVSNNTPAHGQTIQITIKVKNNGPLTVPNVQIKDLLPTGLTYAGIYRIDQGSYNSGTGIWTIGSMNTGNELILILNATVNAQTGTLIYNDARRTDTSLPDYNTANNAQTIDLLVTPSADIAVTQTTSTSTPSRNSNVTLTITVTNNGPDTANNVQITSLLPSGLQWVSDNSGRAYDHVSGIWTVGTMTSGQSLILTLIAKVIGAGTINNTAAKTAETEYDPNLVNDQQNVILTVPVPSTSADIQVTQNASKTSLNTAEPVTITITVKNNGPNSTGGVQVTDLLPAGLNYYSHTASIGSYNSTTGIWNIGTLNSNQSCTLIINAIPTALGDLVNLVSKTAETEYDSNLSNDFQSITYSIISNKVTNFTDPGQPGGTVNTDDGTSTKIALPFNVTLYGQTYNTIYISVNGAVSFNAPIPGPYYSTLPSSSIAYVAPFWADFDVTYAGNIYYTVSDDRVIITWEQVPAFTEGSNPTMFNTVQLIITSDGKYGFVYGDLQWKNQPDDTYPSYARFNKGDTTTYSNFWTGSQDLSALANQTFWFDSNGQQINV